MQRNLFQFGVKRPRESTDSGENSTVSLTSFSTLSVEKRVKLTVSCDKDVSEKNSKVRKFNEAWLKAPVYSKWLRFEDKKMTCSLCIEAKKTNNFVSGSVNFQKSGLDRHFISQDHKEAEAALLMRKGLQKCVAVSQEEFNKQLVRDNRSHESQIRTVYMMCQKLIPANLYGDLIDLQIANGCPHLENPYRGYREVAEMEDAIATVVTTTVKQKLTSSPFIGIMADETNDITTNKKLIMYARLLTNGKAETVYLGNVTLADGTANSICKSICDKISECEIDFKCVVGLGTDGASVMMGHKNGVGAKLKEKCGDLIQIHCEAHKLNLASSQAAKNVPYMVKYQGIISSIYAFYSDSAVRYHKLRELQQLLHGHIQQVHEPTHVRWLSIQSAVQMIKECWPSIVYSLSHEFEVNKSAKAKGLLNTVESFIFMAMTCLMVDVMNVICAVSRVFQKDDVNFSMVHRTVKSAIETLESMQDNNNCATLSEFMESITEDDSGESYTYKCENPEGEVIENTMKFRSESHKDAFLVRNCQKGLSKCSCQKPQRQIPNRN